ncbi:putative MFS transporter [Azospirillaceae bacterium]
MRKLLIAALMLVLLPLSAHAQSQPAAQSVKSGGGAMRSALVTVGIVGGVVAADLLTGGGVTSWVLGKSAAPIATVVPPASPALMALAVENSVVLGTRAAAATARADGMALALLRRAATVVVGGVAGGVFGDWLSGR